MKKSFITKNIKIKLIYNNIYNAFYLKHKIVSEINIRNLTDSVRLINQFFYKDKKLEHIIKMTSLRENWVYKNLFEKSTHDLARYSQEGT